MRKGWFKIPGVQDGDRTLEQQLKGLGPMLNEVSGKRVLEYGCAEGLILVECLRRGAAEAFGIEMVLEAVFEAMRQLTRAGGNPRANCGVCNVDLDRDPDPHGASLGADIVLMLAILHKLKDPLDPVTCLLSNGRTHPNLIVLRTPAKTPGFVQDPRSGMKRYEVSDTIIRRGYRLERVERGHEDEWTGYFRRAA